MLNGLSLFSKGVLRTMETRIAAALPGAHFTTTSFLDTEKLPAVSL